MADETTPEPGATPSQTIGPFFHVALLADDLTHLVNEDHPRAFRLRGTVYDGEGQPVPDAMVEIWQADPEGCYAHHDDPEFTGFGRSGTKDGFEFVTVKPGVLESSEQAPHVLVSIFARGLLKRVVTRIYFPDEEQANATDPVLSAVEEGLRPTLVAEPEEDGLRFDVRLQEGPNGEPETVFFDV